jgi:hypothetical protein
MQSGFDDVCVVGGTERLADHVFDANALKDGTGCTTGDDASTWGGRLQ